VGGHWSSQEIPTPPDAMDGSHAVRRRAALATLAAAGAALSGYVLRITAAKQADPTFTAPCDVSEAIACTRVVTSVWSRGFGTTRARVASPPLAHR
jgi:uncharacterized membrane protein